MLFYGLFPLMALAQEVVVPSGGIASGSSGTSDYTIGQIVYATHTGSNGSVTEGIQQAYEIFISLSTEDTENIILTYKVYPNPTSDLLTLKVDDFNKRELTFQLYDLNGKFLEGRKISSNETLISMKNYRASIYLLRINNNNNTIKLFRIIKN